MRWTVSVPVWGSWHVKTYIERVLWRHVLMGLEDCRYIVHTDAWNQINESAAMKRLKRFCEVEYRSLPADLHGHQKLAWCHADAMKDAEGILFLMPDCVQSVETFDFVKNCAKKLVVLGSLRTLSEPHEEIPLHSSELADWSVKHLHPNWQGLIWNSKEGQAASPTNIYFKSETGFWMHGFHLHPIACVLDQGIRDRITQAKERGTLDTVDGKFVADYSKEEVYVVTDREIAQCEITSKARGEGENCWDITSPSNVANFMRNRANDMHQHFFTHRIMLSGSYNKHCESVPMAILERLRG